MQHAGGKSEKLTKSSKKGAVMQGLEEEAHGLYSLL